MGAGGSKKQVDADARKNMGVTQDDIKNQNVPYMKNYNLRQESDYDDEIDSFAGDERLDIIAAGRKRKEELGQVQIEPEEENQLLLDDDDQPGGEMIVDENGESLAKVKQEIRPVRAEMDPQSKNALEDDLQNLKGQIIYNDSGLLGFNLFMHLFIIITRHTREQFIKEQRKVVVKRRRAFKLKAKNEYSEIVQHEIDMERLKYHDIVNYVLNYLEIQDGAYKSSFVKY